MPDTQNCPISTSILSSEALKLFLAYGKDAANWSGTPLIGGNLLSTAAHRGYLTKLKKAKLITTWTDEERCTWLEFTPEGRALLQVHGVKIYD